MILAIGVFVYFLAIVVVVKVLRGLHNCDRIMGKMIGTIGPLADETEQFIEHEHEDESMVYSVVEE